MHRNVGARTVEFMMMDALDRTGSIEPPWVGQVLHYWFEELSEANWFVQSADVDAQIRDRFLALHERLRSQAVDVVSGPCALLASVIVLDQFSRNMFRGDPQAFASDPIARQLARRAIDGGFDQALTARQRFFLYLPFEHSEDLAEQQLSVSLMQSLGNEEWTQDAIQHRDIVECFGRFPHRNAVLGRDSSPEEIEFLRVPLSWY